MEVLEYTQEGIILWDGAWTSCSNLTDELCIRAENLNNLSLYSERNVRIMPATGYNVGIGTTSPSSYLDVTKTYTSTSGISTSLSSVAANSTAITTTSDYTLLGGKFDAQKSGADSGTNSTYVYGVYSTAGQAPSVSSSGNKYTYGVFGYASGNLQGNSTTYGLYGGAYSADTNYGIYAEAGSGTANYAGVFMGGNVGVGLTAPAYKLDVTGSGTTGGQDINVTGCYRDTGTNVAGTCASDIRLKHSIESISDSLTLISQLNPKSYEFYDSRYGTGRQFGLIAQEVELVRPDWVETDPDSGIKMVKYGQNLTMYALAGVKDLNAKFEELKLDSEGEVVLTGSNGIYMVTQVGSGTPIAKLLAAAQVITGKVQAGLVSTQELVVQQSAQIGSLSVNSLTVAGQTIQEYVTNLVQQQLASSPAQIASGSAQLATTSAQIANLSAANITTTTIASDTLITDTATISGDLSAPIAIFDDLTTQNLTATGTTTLGSLMTQTATISGSIGAAELNVTGTSRLDILQAQQAELADVKVTTAEMLDATVSGTLYVENIYDLDGKISRALQKPGIMDIITNNLPEPLPEADPVSVYNDVESAGYTINPDMLSVTGSEVSLVTGDVILTAQAAYVEKYLQVNGLAYVAQSLGVGENIIIGNSTIMTDRSIAYAPTSSDDIFYFQPTGQGKLDFLAGVMTIENGKVAITGSLTVAGTTKTETLLTNLIQPADFGNPFQVQVAGISSQSGELKKSRFEIVNELGTPVATISAEGKANFAGGIGIGSEILSTPEVASGSSATVTASKTSGKSTLGAHATQITIESDQITENSLIYVTPVSSTQNQVLYVKSQTAENPTTGEKEGKFVVGFDQPINTNVNFNWWIIN